MKLQIAFDMTDLEKALQVAHEIESYADIMEVGTLLIYRYGNDAITQFKKAFPSKAILADAKIADRGKEAPLLFAHAGADWITVLAGVDRNLIHLVAQTAHGAGKKIMLDLIDASSLGQVALDAKSLGADALLFHRSSTEDSHVTNLERWEMVKGNTQLPIYICGQITRDNIHDIIMSRPMGIVISSAITDADDPRSEAAFFAALLNNPT